MNVKSGSGLSRHSVVDSLLGSGLPSVNPGLLEVRPSPEPPLSWSGPDDPFKVTNEVEFYVFR